MPPAPQWMSYLGVVVITAPFLLMVVLGSVAMLGRRLSEPTTERLVQSGVIVGLLAAVGILVAMLSLGTRHVAIPLGDWVAISRHYHFSVKLVFDRLSVPMAILSFLLSGTIGAFASKYLHREPGYHRFFLLYAIFLLGMVLASLAGTIETLFSGWELVGLSSALLVAYYQERQAPARNGLWVWIIYRVSDAALLLAAVVMHHLRGEGDLDQILGTDPWPMNHATIAGNQAFLIGFLMLVAAAGKSALVPFSGWLPRAMEGPTPSSAVFYGALSVHLGAFLLLRIGPILDVSPALRVLVVALGLTTAVLSYLAGSVQTDIKSALSFASLTQVAIIVVEIGLGFRYLALVHLLGHACLRTLQFLRAPTLLHDYHTLENAIGEHLSPAGVPWERPATRRASGWLYRLALEQGYLDTALLEYIVRPFLAAFRWCDRQERRWTDYLDADRSRGRDESRPSFGTIEEFS